MIANTKRYYQMSYIKQLTLKKIRGFEELKIDFSNGEGMSRMKTLIIGKNGIGKTSILRCITLGLCDPPDGNSLIAEPNGSLIGEKYEEAEISITLGFNKKGSEDYYIKTILRRQENKEVVSDQKILPQPKKAFKHYVYGYGAGRCTVGPGGLTFRDYRIIDSAYSLFVYDSGLTDTELTLRRLRDYVGEKVYENTMKGIKNVLDLFPEDKIDLPRGGGVVISGPHTGKNIPLAGWADGYRITLGWILDIYAWAMRADQVADNGDIKGILLIDELEQHLHPSVQGNILPRLSKLFPSLQIIATTHSPLLVLGATSEETVVFKREEGKIIKEEFVPDFSGYSAEDILVDENLFDTGAYSQEINEKIQKYRNLLSIPKKERKNKQKNEIRDLSRELLNLNILDIPKSPLVEELKKFSKKFEI